jgi:hypothetical protein
VRINMGGPLYSSSTGQAFRADTFFAGGTTHASSSPISGTPDPALYQNERFGNFSYAIPIANGSYDVRLHFVELYFGTLAPGGAGRRVFGIDIAETPGVDFQGIDVYATVGPNAALVRTVPAVTVSDGVLDVRSIYGTADDPELAAIELIPTGTAPPPPPPASPPTVTSTQPAAGATEINTLVRPRATFSRALDPTTITSDSVTLTGPGGALVAANVSYDPVLLRAILTPTAQLATSTTYTARVGATVKGADGVPLENAFSWTFTTAATLGQPMPVSSTAPASSAAGRR